MSATIVDPLLGWPGVSRSDAHQSTAPRIDAYGNPIEHAIAEYRIDANGDAYEAHAPDIALTALAPPGT